MAANPPYAPRCEIHGTAKDSFIIMPGSVDILINLINMHVHRDQAGVRVAGSENP